MGRMLIPTVDVSRQWPFYVCVNGPLYVANLFVYGRRRAVALTMYVHVYLHAHM